MSFVLTKDTYDQDAIQLTCYMRINHFTVMCLVTWPMNEREVRVDFVLIETTFFLNMEIQTN